MHAFRTLSRYVKPLDVEKTRLLFRVESNNFAHIEEVNTHSAEGCGKMTFDTGSTRIWDWG